MKKHHKVIMMVFASEDHELFRFFKKCWLTFKDSHPDIKVFFVYGRGSGLTNKTDYDLCYENVPESHNDGIKKVLYALEHIDRNYTCDYFVHTNLSTFWRFDKLIEKLDQLPKNSFVMGPPDPRGRLNPADQLPKKPFVMGPACRPSDFQWLKRKIYLFGYAIIVDGNTVSLLAKRRTEILTYKDHPLTLSTIGAYFPEDMILSIYLLDVFKLPFTDNREDGMLFVERRDDPIDWNKVDDKIDNSDKYHYRCKTKRFPKDRIGIDDVIFKRLTEKYYGKVPF